MSGHNKWSGIKHRKAAVDSKRAQSFTKHAKLITIAARDGGGDPITNFQLRLAIDRARLDNMPKDNIDRAIKKGTGELTDGAEIIEILYEGVGPGNVMMLIKTTTDNRNRTVSEVKSIFTKNGGKLGEMGSAMWNFKKVGSIGVAIAEDADRDALEEKAINAGADDLLFVDDILVVYAAPENLKTVQENLEKAGLKIEAAEMAYLPQQTVTLSPDQQIDYEKLLEVLDEHDDVQEVFDNIA
ncbi:MAG: transcriptional regulator [Candidatus Moranbacteria bacterium GW2011_GWA2_39_41]|nr:MAG: transcriptional regulator [Candidatus Moranbacteria bacterium GW2011_GWA2_39_41]